MKKLLQVLFLLPAIASPQSQNQNYIAATEYKVPTLNGTSITGGGTVTPDNKQTFITYFDGLGRPIQKIAHRDAHSGGDIITHIEYDNFGRQVKDFLPYVRTSGSMDYDANSMASVINFYGSPNFAQHRNPSFEATGTPFSEKKLENSPLERLLKHSAPGNDWAMPVSLSDPDHTIRYEYQTVQQGEIRRYSAISTWNAANGSYDIAILNPQMSMVYATGQLYKTIVRDENWTTGQLNTVEEYSNKTGQVVLKRSFNLINGIVEAHDTYYVYDQYDNLTFVVPPLAYGNIGTDLDGLCFQYKYDARNRLVEKKVPGKQWEYIVYNKFDQAVATGPATSPFNEPDKIGWLITKYDGFSRPVITGWLRENAITSIERKKVQDIMDAQTANLYEKKLTTGQNSVDGISFRYTNLAWPTGSSYNVLTINYYDDYNFPLAPATFSVMFDGNEQAYYNNTSHKPKGLPTATWIRVLTTSSSTKGELSYFLYDKKARPVRVYSVNYLSGLTYTDSKLDFEGKLLSKITYHRRDPAGGQELTIREDFIYSPQGRLLTHAHQVTPAGQIMPQERLSWNDYTELGQLKSKRAGGGMSLTPEGLQKMDFSYNIRGWLTTINSVDNLAELGEPTDLFGLKLNYNTVEVPNAVGTAMHNGNISEAYWMTHPENIMRKYSYEYDGLNRLTEAVYQKPRLNNPTTNAYNESVEYDKNGNILHLTRSGYQDNDSGYTYEIDDLEYRYKSNRLTTVIDHSNSWDGFKDGQNPDSSQTEDYKYDGNGNMTQDWNKEISNITYNHLNLPTKIEFGTNGQRKIQYIYNALGIKVKKTVTDPLNNDDPILETDYLGEFQYQNGLLQFFPTAEGYVSVTEGIKFNYVYTYKDHLGNVRLSYSKPKGGDITILEENHYYPFGMKHINYGEEKNKYVFNPDQSPLYAVLEATERSDYQYKYNGKEYQDELGLNFYDYGARNYDPAIGRWTNVDPLAEMYPDISPYAYAANNPIMFVDYDGRNFGIIIDHKNLRITITGHFFASKKDKKLLDSVAAFLNGQTGILMKVGEGEAAVAYEMSFNITTEESTDPAKSAMEANYNDKEGGNNNSFIQDSNNRLLRGNERGAASVTKAVVRDEEGLFASTHEALHVLGSGHKDGIMKNGSTSGGVTAGIYGAILSGVGIGDGSRGSGNKNAVGVGRIRQEDGTRPEGFTAGTIMTRAKFDRQIQRAIEKREKQERKQQKRGK